MAFVDELNVHIKAGKGGNGVVRWLHEKYKEFGGPAGGNGGKGGDVYIKGVKDLSLLSKYIQKDRFDAENGEGGKNKSQEGKNGEGLIIDLPVGSIVTNLDTGERFELEKEEEMIKILKGGKGGFGNEHFKASTNVRPIESTPGKPGEEADFRVELELFADAGLIGLPSAGKSSLLNALTGAKSKVGEYDFTTLEPHLGNLFGFILADIPGLIEGAALGKGLGHKFLKHIKRTKTLFHLIPANSNNAEKDYQVIRKELSDFGSGLEEKKEIIIITKTDEVNKGKLENLKKIFKDKQILFSSILDDQLIKKLADQIVKILREEV